MVSNDIKEAFRILKRKGILAGEIALELSISEGYLSKIKNGSEGLSEDNLVAFNKKYGQYITLDHTLINEKPRGRKPNSTPKGSILRKAPSDHILNRQELFLLVGQIDSVLKEKQVSAEDKLVRLRGLIKQLKSGISYAGDK